MLEWIKVTALQLGFLSSTLAFQQDYSIVLSGTFNCRTKKVQIVRLKNDVPVKDEFESLDHAVAALRKADFSESGLAILKQIVTEACSESKTSEFRRNAPVFEKANWRAGFFDPGTFIAAENGSLVFLEKRGEEIQFVVFKDQLGIVQYDYKGNANRINPAEAMRAQAQALKTADCRPISKVCVKCADGRIICTTPKLR